MSTCPSSETLGRLARWSSGTTQLAEVEHHVETCAACQKVLEHWVAHSYTSQATDADRLPMPERLPVIPGFVIERELGRGGMGVVYQGFQPRLDRHVAVKVVVVGAEISDAERGRWLDEARALARLRHPNIVHIYEAGEQEGCLYLVLDLIPGGSLADRTRDPLPERVAAKLMTTVALAVHKLHEAGILHLDLKPSNILLDGPLEASWDQLTPMVADFGISRTNGDLDARSEDQFGMRGTPSYMAPEQCAADQPKIGERTDVYALGATLYCLVTGRPPFQAATSLETRALVRNSEPALPRTLVPSLAHDLETIVLTCLNKDPQRRYATAEALANDLQRWLDGFPIQARPVSGWEHTRRWCRRRPGFAAVLALFMVTVTASLLGLFLLWRRSESALAHAVESDHAATGALRDLVGLLTLTADEPQLVTSERIEKAARVVRDLMAKLRRNPGFSAVNVAALGDLTRLLSEDFRHRGNYAESRALLKETLMFFEELKNRTADPRVDVESAKTFRELGYVAQNEGHIDEALSCFRRAETVLSGMIHDPRELEAITSLDLVRRWLAKQLECHGQIEARRRLLESHIQLLDRLNRDPAADPAVGLFAELTRLNLAPDPQARDKLRACLRRFPAGARLSASLQQALVEWIVGEVDPYPSGAAVLGTPKSLLEPDAHADAVIRAIESRCEAIGADASVFAAVALNVSGEAASRGAAQRKAGRLDDARATTASLSAFAKKLVQRNPDEATFHSVMCEALLQEAKAAWQVEDYALIEATWRNALVEAKTAVRLAPMHFSFRTRLASLQEKLLNLTGTRQAAP